MRRRDVFRPRLAAGVLLLLLGVAPAVTVTAAPTPDDRGAVEEANQLLREASAVYTRLAAFTDTMTFVTVMPGMENMPGMEEMKSTARIRLDGDAVEAMGVAGVLNMTAVDGAFYLRLDGAEGAVKTKLGDDPLDAVKKAIGMAYPYLPPQIGLRWSKGIDGVTEWFGFGLLEEPAVTGHGLFTAADGAELREIILTSRDGKGTSRVRLDPRTKLIRSIVAEGAPEGLDGKVKMTATFEPKIMARLDTPIMIDLEGVKLYETIDAMMMASQGDINPSIEVGTPAPGFALVDQTGKKHASDGYRGKIMMLDWWGVW